MQKGFFLGLLKQLKLNDVIAPFASAFFQPTRVSVRQTTKKERITSTEAAPIPDSPPQAPEGQKHLLHLSNRLSSKFWDNLSRIWLTRPAI